MTDLSTMQISKTTLIFEKSLELFFKKWRGHSAEVDSFLEYFQLEKVEKHGNWYEALKCNEWCPLNTNSIECGNRVIKDQDTFRERWPLGRFCGKTLEIVHSWSFDRNVEDNVNAKTFHLVPVIELKHWKKAYEYLKVNFFLLFMNS